MDEMDNQINQTVELLKDLSVAANNDILYEENSNGANRDMCDHYPLCTVADLKALATAYTKAVADLATAKQGLETERDYHYNLARYDGNDGPTETEKYEHQQRCDKINLTLDEIGKE